VTVFSRTILLLAAASAASPALAAAQPIDVPRLVVPRVTSAPQRADFESMEVRDAPFGMRRVEGFVQRFPNDGAAVSERTIVYVGYDPEFLYVVFLCFDRDIDRIGAHMLPRDAFPNDEDTVAVHIDTFRDLKHAYGFQVNAYGVQTDGTYTEGQGWDLSWDTVWQSEATPTKAGYVVLFRIPFKSLRFPATDGQQWGIFFYRAIARRSEQVYWPACSTRVAARFRQAAIVDGIEHVSPGRNLQAIPYAAARSFRALDASAGAPPSFVSRAADGAFGVDLKSVVHDSLVVDATVNPDFSQVESDLPQITVNRPFEVFFPEKRPFFLENATYFATPIQLLFTRRIADPAIGGRATGRVGRYAIGAMIVDDNAPVASPGADDRAWFGVARLIRDVGRESYVGAFVSERRGGSIGNDVAAVDGRLKLGANWFAAGQTAVTGSRAGAAAARPGSAVFASLVGSGRRFNYQLDYNDRSAGFAVAEGFIPRVDIRSVDQTYAFRARPSHRTLQAWGPDVVVERTWDASGQPLDWSVTPRFELQWPGTTILDVSYTAARQTLRPSEVATATVPQRADVSRIGATFSSAILPRLIGSASLFAGAAPNIAPARGLPIADERIADATASATVRLTDSLMLDVSYLFDRLLDDESRQRIYGNGITRVRLGEQFTRALAVRAIVEYTQLGVDAERSSLRSSRNLDYDLLLTYVTTPGTAIYLGANYNLADIDSRLLPVDGGLLRSAALTNTGWQVFTKVSYLFRR
jgi:Domain of unknown function (DUF5916)/Carbohydrate family 9 binding domain-like